MKTAYLFPGQGSQFKGMGKDLYQSHSLAKELFELADSILGYSLSEIMFEGTEEELKQTKVTQPAIFLHSVIKYKVAGIGTPDMVAGHSLGEFSAMVAAGALSFQEALKLVYLRATAMQRACELNPSTMAAVLGLADEVVEEICKSIKDEVVVAANYNCPGQLVISGSFKGIEDVTEPLKAAGAKRVLPLQVGGAFHSPFMEPASLDLAKAIEEAEFSTPTCAVYQNFDALPTTDVAQLRDKLMKQLVAPVRWTQTIQKMSADGATLFLECGPGNVLQGLVKKIINPVETGSV
jgi:[acyl-carrier-protein] S-malonyltransferase